MSLVRVMFALRHPACAAHLRCVHSEQQIIQFWQDAMRGHSAWQEAQAAATAAQHDQLRALLVRLMQ